MHFFTTLNNSIIFCLFFFPSFIIFEALFDEVGVNYEIKDCNYILNHAYDAAWLRFFCCWYQRR